MVKFIHTADWHLGMQAHFLPPEARARFAQERFDSIVKIAEVSEQERCSFVIVAGDVFDSNLVDRAVIAKAIEALSSFTIPVLLLPGNHDPLDPSSLYATRDWTERRPASVTVLTDTTAVAVSADEEVSIIGAPRLSRHQVEDPLAPALSAATGSAGLRVLVGHGVVDTLSPARDDPSLISSSLLTDGIADGTVHYVALGDRHSTTEIPGTGGRAWYAGTPVSTDHGEVDPDNVLIVSLDRGSCTAERKKVGEWSFVRESFDLNTADDIRGVGRWLDGQSPKHQTAAKLLLRGAISLADAAKLDEILDRHRLTFADVSSEGLTGELAVVPDDQDMAALDVSGYVRDALDELMRVSTQSTDESSVAQDALRLLYRLANTA